jgi:hypothetical protein
MLKIVNLKMMMSRILTPKHPVLEIDPYIVALPRHKTGDSMQSYVGLFTVHNNGRKNS